MQRLEAKNPPERPLMSAETGNVENRRQDPPRDGLFLSDDGFRSSGGLPKNRRRSAAYAAYDFVESYAIDPKMTPSGTRLGPLSGLNQVAFASDCIRHPQISGLNLPHIFNIAPGTSASQRLCTSFRLDSKPSWHSLFQSVYGFCDI
jgi:hypothetical protein